MYRITAICALDIHVENVDLSIAYVALHTLLLFNASYYIMNVSNSTIPSTTAWPVIRVNDLVAAMHPLNLLQDDAELVALAVV